MQKQVGNDILFPFGQVRPGEKVLIYGAGNVGHIYLDQIRRTNYCVFEGFIDRNYKKKNSVNSPVYGIDSIKKITYDHIVIAIKNLPQQNIIKEQLISAGVQADKIIFFQDNLFYDADECKVIDDGETLACRLDCVSIAVFLSGGIGDCIVTKKMIEALLKFSSRVKIDFFTKIKKEDIYAIHRGELYLNEIVSCEYDKYKKIRCLYHVGINMGNFPEIEWLATKEEWLEEDFTLRELINKIMVYRDNYKNGMPVTHFLHYHRQIYLGKNCYSSLSCEGLIPVEGHKVHVPFDDAGRKEFDKLKLKKYITINYGNGSSIEYADRINKQWPYRHFVTFVNLFKSRYPNIDIVQIGAYNACKIDNTDIFLQGKSLEIIKHVLYGAIFHLDIEGGMVHLATQLGTKCVVLFGPTLEDFFAYPENVNIRVGNCQGCWELYGADRRCAKNCNYSECMALITPELVMEKIHEAGIEIDEKEF